MFKQLYIIGNGFDIHHGIPSRYSNFRDWLEYNNAELIDELRNIYDVDSETWWNEFEKELGNPNLAEYIENTAFENQPDFSSEYFRDRDYYNGEIQSQNEIGGLVTSIKETFTDWINSFPQPKSDKKIKIDKTNAFFINFNYTDTLQKLYGIKQENILFIHGNAGINELVLGNNRNYEDLYNEFTPDSPQPPSNLNNEELSQWYEENEDNGEDYIHQTARDAAISEVFGLHKDTSAIIKKMKKHLMH